MRRCSQTPRTATQNPIKIDRLKKNTSQERREKSAEHTFEVKKAAPVLQGTLNEFQALLTLAYFQSGDQIVTAGVTVEK